jgi:hypothetical protein
MKNITLIILLSLSFVSCKKYESKQDCTCGVVTNDALTSNSDGSFCYSLTVKNNCSGNLKTWCFSASTWYEYAVGDNMCVSNVGTW